MNKYKWLLFDADGTLFDYNKAEENALRRTIEQLGYAYDPGYLVAYKRVNRKVWLEFEQGQLSQSVLKVKRFELLLETTQLQYQPERASQKYLANLGQGSYLLDGAEALIKALCGQYGLVIITNGLKEVQRPRLAKSAINAYFENIIISDEVGAAKPAPEIFDIAFAAMDHPRKEEVLIIGDSLTSDIQGGLNYGIDTCWFNPNSEIGEETLPPITYRIKRLAELLELLKGTA